MQLNADDPVNRIIWIESVLLQRTIAEGEARPMYVGAQQCLRQRQPNQRAELRPSQGPSQTK